MLSTRYRDLLRYGLIGSSLLAARPAQAESCDYVAERTVAFVLGLQVSPEVRLVGGIEGRQCFNDSTEGLLRFEIGGGSPRLIAGARVRPFESWDSEGDLELVGFEAGGILDFQGKLGAHLAATYGTHSAYLAAQARANISDSEAPTRWSLLGGFSPWTAVEPQVVEGRPIAHAGGLVRPRIMREHVAARTAEGRAVRDHFVASAQMELSSVWTFMRLAAELVAVGAPHALVMAALDAADDEVRHARLCAGAAGGVTLAALPQSLARPRFTTRSLHALAVLAAEAWCEGCLNETAAAEQARYAAEDASGSRRTMLAAIARDEAGHAELSWAVLEWITSIAPMLVRTTLAQIPRGEMLDEPVDRALARHGVPTAAVTAAARAYAEQTACARLAELV